MQELGSFGSRIRTMHTGPAYEHRVHLVQQKCLRRLAMVAEADDWDAPRQTLTFDLGSGMTSVASD